MEQTTQHHLVKHVAVNICTAICLNYILAFIFYICDIQCVAYKAFFFTFTSYFLPVSVYRFNVFYVYIVGTVKGSSRIFSVCHFVNKPKFCAFWVLQHFNILKSVLLLNLLNSAFTLVEYVAELLYRIA